MKGRGERRALHRCWVPLFAGGLALSCGGESETPLDCSPAERKAFVADLMSDYYLWYDRAPAPDWAELESPQAVMSAMMFRELDRWSGMRELVESQQYFDEGRFQGLGYSLGRDPDGLLRVSWVHEGSPAGRAGLSRGALLGTINGLDTESLSANELGAELARDVVHHEVELLDGRQLEVELERGDVEITSVKSATVLDLPVGKVGYFMFTAFVLPGEDELRRVFADFAQQGVERLVVDLRYNGGGLLRTAALLGSLLRRDAAGEPLVIETYNDRHENLNRPRSLFATDEGLNATHVAFLTTARTASASEQVINGLRPYLSVSVVGQQTLGKPVGADSWHHCGYSITPITFHSLNSDGDGGYFDGLIPNCTTPDDLLHDLGDPEEAQLSAALALLNGEACPSSKSSAVPQPPAQGLPEGPVPDQVGWY